MGEVLCLGRVHVDEASWRGWAFWCVVDVFECSTLLPCLENYAVIMSIVRSAYLLKHMSNEKQLGAKRLR
jgi:hypothetical protein